MFTLFILSLFVIDGLYASQRNVNNFNSKRLSCWNAGIWIIISSMHVFKQIFYQTDSDEYSYYMKE